MYFTKKNIWELERGSGQKKNRSGDSCGAGGRCSSGDEYHSAGRRGPLDPNHRRKSRRSSEKLIHESIMTDGDEYAMTDFDVDMNGEDCAVDLISRSVAKGNSYQEYHSRIKGNNRCSGHSECDAILVGKGRVNAAPELYAGHLDASLIHEAAIGKVAGEQILKLRTLGLTEEEAEKRS